MGCQKCNKNKNMQNEQNGQQDNEKTCSTCKKNFIKFLPTVALSLIFFSSAVYGLITFVKDMITLFSK
jgi:hypothetical protein